LAGFKAETRKKFLEEKEKLVEHLFDQLFAMQTQFLTAFSDCKIQLLKDFQEIEYSVLEKQAGTEFRTYLRKSEWEMKKKIKEHKKELKKLKKKSERKEELLRFLNSVQTEKEAKVKAFRDEQLLQLANVKVIHNKQQVFLVNEKKVKLRHLQRQQKSERKRALKSLPLP